MTSTRHTPLSQKTNGRVWELLGKEEWMVTHVYAVLGQAALRHAKRCRGMTDE